MSTYVDFIDSISENSTLASEFKKALRRYPAAKLSSWFEDKGYAVSIEECASLARNASRPLKSEAAPRIPY